MKRITVGWKQHLRAVRIASTVLFVVASAGLAFAAPTITAPFVQNGSSVTTPNASGTYNGATFQDGSTGYTVVIGSGQAATLNNTTGPHTGSIVIVGNNSTITVNPGISLNAGNNALGALQIDGAGSVANTGTINGAFSGIQINGPGTVLNRGSVTGVTNSAVQVNGTGTVTNVGSLSAGGGGDGIIINGTGTVTNSGTIASAEAVGIQDNGPGTITLNGGMITSPGDGIFTNSTASVVTVNGRSNISNGTGGTSIIFDASAPGKIVLNLVGVTPAEVATFYNTDVGQTSGTVVGAGETYFWAGYTLSGEAISLETVVDPGLRQIATKIDGVTTPLPLAYDPFYLEALNNPEAAMNELVGREINQGLDTIGINISTTLASDVHQHLDDLITGNQLGGIDLGGLRLSQAGMYAYTDPSAQLDSLLHLTGSSVLGGTEMSTDSKAMVSAPQPPSWGVWVSGDVTLADDTGTSTLSNFHSTLGSPTLGFDYRVGPNLVLGLLGSYTTGAANFDDGSLIGVNTELAALYGAWRDGNWHIDGLAGGGASQFNDTRTTFGGTATSNPRGYDILTDATGGYDFHLSDRWTITPEVGLQYTHLGIDSFSESGAGAFDLNEGDQDIDSLRTHVGFKVAKAYSLGKDLTFIPELRAQWYHECMDDSRGVSTSLPGAPALGSFSVNTFSPQRDFALVGVGLNTAFTGYNGVPVGLFVNYNAQVGQSDYISNSVNAGIRVDF